MDSDNSSRQARFPDPGRPPTRGLVPAHRPGGDFTVGVEEELMIVDARGELLGPAARPLVEAMAGSFPSGVVTGEIYVDQVELNSPPCAGAEAVVRSLRDLRSKVIHHAVRPMAVGVHPSARLGGAVIARSPRYDAIVDEYAGLLRTPTAALQVHVGVPDERTAMLAYQGLRPRLPLLRALAAASPYWHGTDSGLASARSAILRSYPRTTMPPQLTSWDEFVTRTTALMTAAEAIDHTYVWWDLRPRPELGTLEVRVMDAQPSLARVAGLTALVQGVARLAVEHPDQEELSDDVLAVNDQRVVRHGLDARIVDVDATIRPVREIGIRVVREVRAVLAPEHLDAPLDVVEEMLRTSDEPGRQRHVVATGGIQALLTDLADRTANLDG